MHLHPVPGGRFVTRLQYILDCISEECHEIGKLAMKSNRFGLYSDYTGEVNGRMLLQEYADLVAVIEMLIAEEPALVNWDEADFRRWVAAKKHKIEDMMRYAPEPVV